MTKKSVKVGTLKKEVYTEILTNSNLQAAVMLASGKSFSTVRVWASEQNARLETWEILKLLKTHFGYGNIEDLFETEKIEMI